MDKIKGTEGFANSMSYWTFTYIFEEGGSRKTPFHGGFGMLNYQSIKKPSYNAFNFLNRLGETELINKYSASWVTMDKKGNIQLLFWNLTVLNKGDSVNNDVYYKRDLPAKDKGNVQLKLTNVSKGKYTLKVTKVGYKSNDAFATYFKFVSPNQLTKLQEITIKEANSEEAEITKRVEVKGDKQFYYTLPMRENDVYLVKE